MSNDHRWQHPAERAAELNPDLIVNAPPLSKRLTALTATMSVLASVVVLFIAIPKGIDEYRDDSSEIVPTSTTPLVKSTSVSQLLFTARSTTGVTSAVSFGRGMWIVASDKVAASQNVTITSKTGATTVVRQVATMPDSGISILHCVSSCSTEAVSEVAHLADPNEIENIEELRVVDAFSSQALHVAPSVAMVGQTSDSPIHITDSIHGVALAVNSYDQVVGIVVRKNHSNWLLGKKNLDAIVNLSNK